MWNKRYIVVPDTIDGPIGVDAIILYDPTVEDRNNYLFHKEREEVRNRKLEVPTEGDVFAAAKKADYWTEDDELILREADDHIQYLEHELSKKGFPARRRQIESQIQATKEKQLQVKSKEVALKVQTAEHLAHEIASTHMLISLVKTLDDQPLWETEEEFVECNNQYPAFVQFLIYEMLSEGVWEIPEIREIARAPEWRMFWVLQRNNLPGLFERPVGDLNVNQKLLVYWSRIYDSALEGMEPPEEDVINDDDRFDEWLANRDLERKESKESARRPNSSHHHQEQMMVLDGEFVEECKCGLGHQKGVPLGRRQRHASDCRYGTWRNYTQQEKDALASQIYGRNNAAMRKYLVKEQDKVVRHGVVKEQDLRDKTSRKILQSNVNITPIRRK
jgi:hypothetical protein